MVSTSPNKVIAAGILGFLAGILYAPRKGTETQEKFKTQFEDVKSQIKDSADRAKEKLERTKKSGKDVAETVDKKIDETAEDVMS